METLKIGNKALEFCLPDENDKIFCLNKNLGKWIILYFYPKDNTSGCTLEAINFSKNINVFKEMNTIVIGISPDSPKSHCLFRDKHELKIILLSDTNHEVLKKYGVWVLKKMYSKKYFGVERSTFIIDPVGKIVSIWRKVKVQDHVKMVEEELHKLQTA
jgi:peroxiredoxin Q/BCP